jgi:predicted ATPase
MKDLENLNLETRISTPKCVVTGDQSNGKSSVVEALTGIALPRQAGTCTKYAFLFYLGKGYFVQDAD